MGMVGSSVIPLYIGRGQPTTKSLSDPSLVTGEKGKFQPSDLRENCESEKRNKYDILYNISR